MCPRMPQGCGSTGPRGKTPIVDRLLREAAEWEQGRLKEMTDAELLPVLLSPYFIEDFNWEVDFDGVPRVRDGLRDLIMHPSTELESKLARFGVSYDRETDVASFVDKRAERLVKMPNASITLCRRTKS
jgi:hypothetical protein